MRIRIHSHARLRMQERGATAAEVRQTVLRGSVSPAKFGRTRFRLTFRFDDLWNGKHYARKRIDAFATSALSHLQIRIASVGC